MEMLGVVDSKPSQTCNEGHAVLCQGIKYIPFCRWMILRSQSFSLFWQLLRERVVCVAAGLRHALAATGDHFAFIFTIGS